MNAHEEHGDHDAEEFRGTLTVTFVPSATGAAAASQTDGPAAEPPTAPAPVAVAAHVAGNFDPLTGGYRWVGRLAPHEDLKHAFEAGWTEVTLETPDGDVGHGTLREANLWGGYRVTGTGSPPFPVPEIVLDGETS
ncbi:DUF4873 domain-containing protein [Lipingzhangella sp. LS1_29]|uniref:DUF4873 domain-containing protein n=1 Tax=Lipingzhangella rawalii TaxID=2055835 RepID=A0ABU2HB66_9ACTN|nr:DUF4873 domain-containing protein [Lipingzhangella rawalii]MDS1272562.1 DUF4873 domain-containing protein [Lipingzhangella rawalii]